MTWLKYIWYIVAALVLIGLVLGAYFYGRKPPVTTTITKPVETQIIYRQLPAQIIVAPDGHEIASLDTTLVSKDSTATVDMHLKYDEQSNLFDVNAKITTLNTTKIIEKKPPFMSPVCGLGIGFQNGLDLKQAQIDVGVRFVGKYDVTIFYNTEKTFGARVGVRF
jgi:hypothetical protein